MLLQEVSEPELQPKPKQEGKIFICSMFSFEMFYNLNLTPGFIKKKKRVQSGGGGGEESGF